MRKSVLTLAVIILLLTACVPAQTTEDVQGQIATAVALTVGAQDRIAESVAMTVAAQLPTATNTATITPTSAVPPTFTPVIPTVTPLPPPSGGNTGGVPPKAEYDCDVIGRRPFDNTEFNAGADFDIKWTIVNTGTKSWYQGFDVKYVSGPNMTTTGATRLQLPALDPGDQYTIVFDAVAPTEKGFHVMEWLVDGPSCSPYVAIIVK